MHIPKMKSKTNNKSANNVTNVYLQKSRFRKYKTSLNTNDTKT